MKRFLKFLIIFLGLVALLLAAFVWIYAPIRAQNLAAPLDWALGILLGLALNFLGILKLIDLLKDANSPYIFPTRFLQLERKQE